MTSKDYIDYLSEARACLHAKKPVQAKQVLTEGLEKFPGQRNLLCLATRTFRACKDHESAIQSANELMRLYPSFVEGYILAAEDLKKLSRHKQALQVVSLGIKRFPTNQRMLYSGLVVYAAFGKYGIAASVGNKLFSLYPEFIEQYQLYVDCLYRCKRDETAAKVIESAYKRFPNENSLIKLRLDLLQRRRDHHEYRNWLYSLLKQNVYPRDELIDRLHRFEFLTAHQSFVQERQKAECDVCCIAADEAPYIAEFIHHYLYLGFSNIFIGLNNSSDQTEFILQQIRLKHPNVHIVDVNHAQSCFAQSGSYRVLFNYARQHSKSAYCLFVDVDEFWVADPFPKKIGEFIVEKGGFDVYSFHWIVNRGESLFSPPLSPVQSYSWNHHLKSICRYDADYVNFRCHSPILAKADNVIVMRGNSVNNHLIFRSIGIDIRESSKDYQSSPIGMPGLAWVIHRIDRSEIEYSFRLFRKRAGKSVDTYFKSNRYGYDVPASTPGIVEYLKQLLPNSAIANYHQSLKTFLADTALTDQVAAARSSTSAENIFSKLETLPPKVLREEANLMRRVFKGTRFHDWVMAHT